MCEKENPLKRITLAGIGAVAKGVEQVDEFINGKGRECMDTLVEKGRAVVQEGKEANAKLEQKWNNFCKACRDKMKINPEDLTPEERAELLAKLQQMADADAAEASQQEGKHDEET